MLVFSNLPPGIENYLNLHRYSTEKICKVTDLLDNQLPLRVINVEQNGTKAKDSQGH